MKLTKTKQKLTKSLQKKDEYGVCLINVNDDASIISPCLKETGHKGEHQHIGLCKSKSCFCPKGIGFLIKKDCCNEAFEAGAKQERVKLLLRLSVWIVQNQFKLKKDGNAFVVDAKKLHEFKEKLLEEK